MGDYIPWDSFFLLLVVDTIIFCAYSIFLGTLVAKAAQASLFVGVLVGLVVVVGPILWMTREVARDRSLMGVRRSDGRDVFVYGAAAVLLVAAGSMLVAMFLPWFRAEGAVRGRALALEGSSSDSFVGVLAVGLTVLVLLGAAVSALFSTGRGRSAAVAGLAGTLWLVVVADLWIVADAVGGVAALAEGASAGEATASVELGAAVWLTLLAVVAMFVAAIAMVLSATDPAPGLVPTAVTSAAGAGSAVSTPQPSGTDYGDGF